MDHDLAGLIAAATAFVGTHFALSHPLRGAVVRAVGDKGFQAVYSLVAFATFAWLFVAFRAAPANAPLWDGTDLFALFTRHIALPAASELRATP